MRCSLKFWHIVDAVADAALLELARLQNVMNRRTSNIRSDQLTIYRFRFATRNALDGHVSERSSELLASRKGPFLIRPSVCLIRNVKTPGSVQQTCVLAKIEPCRVRRDGQSFKLRLPWRAPFAWTGDRKEGVVGRLRQFRVQSGILMAWATILMDVFFLWSQMHAKRFCAHGPEPLGILLLQKACISIL